MNTTAGFGFAQTAVTCGQQTTNPVTGGTYTCPWAGTITPFDGTQTQTQSGGLPTGIAVSIPFCPGCMQPLPSVATFTRAQILTAHNSGKFAPQAYSPILVATINNQLYTPTPPP